MECWKLQAEEVWSGVKPDSRHLTMFGCSVLVHVVEYKTGPGDVKGVFMGYPMGTKGYRDWKP